MEAFSLLKYWKASTCTPAPAPAPPSSAAQDTTAILTAVPQNDVETTDDDEADNEDGPFFDLEFAVPDEEEEANEDSEEDAPQNPNEGDSDYDDNTNGNESEREFNFTVSPSTNDDHSSDPNLSEDLFFKGKLVHLEHEPNSKPQFTSSLLKSATKFRVFMLGRKKSKPNVAAASDKDSNTADSAAQKPNQRGPEPKQKKLFTVKFKVEEVPIVSLFTRDNKGAKANKSSQIQKQQNAEESQLPSPSSSEEKQRFSKEAMQKYLKKVKPLYVRVSRRYAEKKIRFSGQLNMSSPPQKPVPAKPAAEKSSTTEAGATESGVNNAKAAQKQGNLPLPAGLRVVCKHLGKSRSASSSVASPTGESGCSRRRDDSLVQQQDGIQSAILHCKKSFNASRECESSQLPQPVSDDNPSHVEDERAFKIEM